MEKSIEQLRRDGGPPVTSRQAVEDFLARIGRQAGALNAIAAVSEAREKPPTRSANAPAAAPSRSASAGS
jgi:hypothetical protein